MLSLSLDQPFAQILLFGSSHKLLQTGAPSAIPDKVLIYANRIMPARFLSLSALEIQNAKTLGFIPKELDLLPVKALIGYAHVVSCIPAENPEAEEEACVIELENPRYFINPIPYVKKARTDLFEVSEINASYLPSSIKLPGVIVQPPFDIFLPLDSEIFNRIKNNREINIALNYTPSLKRDFPETDGRVSVLPKITLRCDDQTLVCLVRNATLKYVRMLTDTPLGIENLTPVDIELTDDINFAAVTGDEVTPWCKLLLTLVVTSRNID